MKQTLFAAKLVTTVLPGPSEEIKWAQNALTVPNLDRRERADFV